MSSQAQATTRMPVQMLRRATTPADGGAWLTGTKRKLKKTPDGNGAAGDRQLQQ